MSPRRSHDGVVLHRTSEAPVRSNGTKVHTTKPHFFLLPCLSTQRLKWSKVIINNRKKEKKINTVRPKTSAEKKRMHMCTCVSAKYFLEYNMNTLRLLIAGGR